MFELNWKPLRSFLTAGLLVVATGAALLPAKPVWAQVRTLPDFTDLSSRASTARSAAVSLGSSALISARLMLEIIANDFGGCKARPLAIPRGGALGSLC